MHREHSLSERRPFAFTVGNVTVTSEGQLLRTWARTWKQVRWTYRVGEEEVLARRSGVDLAIETALRLVCNWPVYDHPPRDVELEDGELVSWEELFNRISDRVRGEYDVFRVGCMRDSGDPTVPCLPPLDPKAEGLGVVYCIEAKDKCKIGFTVAGVEQRLMSLQTGSPVKLRVAFTFPGTRADEKALHRKFRHLRIHREWFHMRDELVQALCLIVLDRGSAKK